MMARMNFALNEEYTVGEKGGKVGSKRGTGGGQLGDLLEVISEIRVYLRETYFYCI